MELKHSQNWMVATALGVLGTFQYHLAQFTSRFDTVFGDRGDVRGVVYFCEHWYQWLLGKSQLMSPGIFYPTKGTLAYSDFLVGYAFPYSIARGLGFGMFASIEIVVILLTLANYFACFLLLKHVLNFKLLPACAAAMFFAFGSPKFNQLPHLQLQFVLFLPLIFACVILFVRRLQDANQREASGWLTAAVILWLLQAATAFYYAWFYVFWTLLFILIALLLGPSRRLILSTLQRYWQATTAASVVLLLGFGLFVLSYLPAIRKGQWYNYDFVSQMIPSWWSLAWMGDGNYAWRWLSPLVVPNPRPSTWNELEVGFGLVATISWLGITIWVLLQRRSRDRLRAGTGLSIAFLTATVLATTLFFLIGFKYGGHSPWFFVYRYFPGGKAIRAVSRYVIFLSLPMAIVFAFVLERGLEWAANRRTKTTRVALTTGILLVAAFGVCEQFGVFRVGPTGFSKKTEEAHLTAMVSKLPRDCTAFYISPGTGKHSTAEYQYDAMLISIMSNIPTLNASSSQFPPDWDLYFVHDPNYETNVKKWIALNHIPGKVCRLEIDPQFEAFEAGVTLTSAEAILVRDQYRFFAGRDATFEEIKRYAERLRACETNKNCDPAEVWLDIFRSSGYFDDGSFIFRLYHVGLGRAPRYDEFNSDLNVFRAVEQKDKATFVEEFVTRNEFTSRYSAISTSDFVKRLVNTGKLPTDTEVQHRLETANKSRAETLLELSETAEASREFNNAAIITLHYFGFLRRDPDATGFANWQGLLQQTGNFQRVTSEFIKSPEYRNRLAGRSQ